MSLLSKIEAQLKSCRFQFTKLNENNRVLCEAINLAEETLEDFKLGHEHAPDLPHTRAMGDTYGWCDYCSTKVSWGEGEAEKTLSQIKNLKEKLK